jgi:hypothetical protein
MYGHSEASRLLPVECIGTQTENVNRRARNTDRKLRKRYSGLKDYARWGLSRLDAAG